MPRPLGSCHGDNNCDRILREFVIWPLAHQTIVNAGGLHGCAGPLLDRYYMFGFRDRDARPTDPEDSFFCGYIVGERFLARLGIPRMPLFDPLLPLPAGDVDVPVPRAPHVDVGQAGQAMPPLHGLNAEVQQVINLLVAIQNIVPTGPTLATLGMILSRPDVPLQDSRVRTLNNYVHAIYRETTFGASLAARRHDIPRLRHYTFPLIREVLARIGAENFIDP